MKITKIRARAKAIIPEQPSGYRIEVFVDHQPDIELEAVLDDEDDVEASSIELQERAGILLKKYLDRIRMANTARKRIWSGEVSRRSGPGADSEAIKDVAGELARMVPQGMVLKISAGRIEDEQEEPI